MSIALPEAPSWSCPSRGQAPTKKKAPTFNHALDHLFGEYDSRNYVRLPFVSCTQFSRYDSMTMTHQRQAAASGNHAQLPPTSFSWTSPPLFSAWHLQSLVVCLVTGKQSKRCPWGTKPSSGHEGHKSDTQSPPSKFDTKFFFEITRFLFLFGSMIVGLKPNSLISLFEKGF